MPSGILDQFTGAQVVITGDHSYIHNGKAYSLAGVTGSIAAAGVEHISFKTPVKSGAIVHLRPSLFSASANMMSMTMVEGAVMTGGTKAVPRNRNRNRPDDSKCQVYTGATLTTAGSATLFKFSVGSGGATSRSGGNNDGSGDELVLKPDTMYSITFETTGASTASVATWGLFWYEEKAGD